MRMPIVLWILFICLCKSLHPNQKLKCSDHILYWHINTDTFNQLFFVVSYLPNFSFVSLKTELPWIIWKIRMLWTPCLVIPGITPLTLISILPCISAHSLSQHIKQPPPSPTSNKHPPPASLPSLDSRDTRKTCCQWHLICNFLN